MKKFDIVVLAGIFISLSSISLPSYAGEDTCDPEPTDMTVNYGDYILCSFGPAGDSDIYRFWGNVGDRAYVEMLEMVADLWPQLVLTSPSGVTERSGAGSTSIILDTILEETGTYTLIADDKYNNVGQYSIYLSCNGGPCLPAPGGAPAVYNPSTGTLSIPEVVVQGTEDRYEVNLEKYSDSWDFFLLDATPIP